MKGSWIGSTLGIAVRVIAPAVVLIALCGLHATAQQEAAPPTADEDSGSQKDQPEPSIEEIRKLKQNPLSALRSLYLQNTNGTVGGESADVFSLQPVWPFRVGDKCRLITYTIIPITWAPAVTPGENSASGLGNILFNGFFRPEKEGPLTWGVGPAIELPTRTNPRLGSDRVSLGPAIILFGSSGSWTGGVVVQNYWSLGGSGSNKVNQFGLQYIVNYNLPKGWYLLSNATITANWLAASQNRWLVPLGGGPGRVFKVGKSKQSYAAAIQGFRNVASPSLGPNWEVIAQFQIIFSMPGT